MRNGSARWLVNRTNPEYVGYVSRVAAVSIPFAQVLINRGLKDPGRLSAFLSSDLSRLSDPFDLPGMTQAVRRIREAASAGQRVLVHGDYDADGLTATSILMEGLRQTGVEAYFFIPNRKEHGYGFGPAGVEAARNIGAALIVTVDCGITALETTALARSLGIDVVITDHHEPLLKHVAAAKGKTQEGADEPVVLTMESFLLPEAVAVVDPKLPGAPQAAVTLSGAGVALLLVLGLFDNDRQRISGLFDLAALGTAADVVPVLDDNRIILKEGLRFIQSGLRPGIKALKDAAGLRPDSFRTSYLYYTLIPRINAAGRMADASDVVRLLCSSEPSETEALARWLNEMNLKRQEVEQRVHAEAMEMARAMGADRGAMVLAAEGWHQGVLGIVASRIAEEFRRPAFVLSIEGGKARGSARSIPAFDILYGLNTCSGLMDRFGGHKQAAGLSLPVENLQRFSDRMSEVVMSTVGKEDFMPALNIDAAVSLTDITAELVNEISALEPFGYGNEEPLFGARGLQALQPRVVGNNHLKMRLSQNGARIDSIGFDLGGFLPKLEDSTMVDAVFQPSINEWEGGRALQLQLKALRPSQ